jgi:hypothetical protein
MSTINIREAELEDLNILLNLSKESLPELMTLPYKKENQLLRHTQNDYRRTHNRFGC